MERNQVMLETRKRIGGENVEIKISKEQETVDSLVFSGTRFQVRFTEDSLDGLKEKLEKLRDSDKDWQTELKETLIGKMKYLKVDKGVTLLSIDLRYADTLDSITKILLNQIKFSKKKKVMSNKEMDEKLDI